MFLHEKLHIVMSSPRHHSTWQNWREGYNSAGIFVKMAREGKKNGWRVWGELRQELNTGALTPINRLVPGWRERDKKRAVFSLLQYIDIHSAFLINLVCVCPLSPGVVVGGWKGLQDLSTMCPVACLNTVYISLQSRDCPDNSSLCLSVIPRLSLLHLFFSL